MKFLGIENIKINQVKLEKIDFYQRSILRLITQTPTHEAELLTRKFSENHKNLINRLVMTNAKLGSKNVKEQEKFEENLSFALAFIQDELKVNSCFSTASQLYHLHRIIVHQLFNEDEVLLRTEIKRFGASKTAAPETIRELIIELLSLTDKIEHPVIRAIYFHHELIRIYPFKDGNGRTARLAKNWMLMYHLYPPIFIEDETDRFYYLSTLQRSFLELNKNPQVFNGFTELFFEQELDRVFKNLEQLYYKFYANSNREKVYKKN